MVTPTPRKNEGLGLGKTEKGGSRVLLDSIRFQLICERYAETGLARASCEELGFKYETVQSAIGAKREEGDDTWGEAWAEAHEKFKESLEREIFARGRDGKPKKWLTDKEGKPVLDADGKMVVTEVEYSDRMLELAARGHFPERYRDRISVSGEIGLHPVDAFANLSVKAKRLIREIIMADLEEQRKARAATVVEAEFTEVDVALEDMRAGEEGA